MAGVVIVTGASAGIGKACADRLQGNGWKVFGASRRGTSSRGMGAGHDGRRRRRARCPKAFNPWSTRRGASTRSDRVCRLGLAGPVENTPISAAKDQLETNFCGAARLVKAALPFEMQFVGAPAGSS